MSLWYRRTFRLPPNDPRYLDLTPLDILIEYHAHEYDDLYSEDKLGDIAEDDGFDLDRVLDEMGSDENWDPVINDS